MRGLQQRSWGVAIALLTAAGCWSAEEPLAPTPPLLDAELLLLEELPDLQVPSFDEALAAAEESITENNAEEEFERLLREILTDER